MFALLLTAFMLGLMGSGHCAGMCGGIVVSLNSVASNGGARPLPVAQRFGVQLVFNVGRLLSYMMIGGLAATSIGAAALLSPLGPAMRVAAALMTIVIGLAIADWWRGIAVLERLGQSLWRFIQPLSQRMMAGDSLWHVLGLGLVWGWLPCGLVYTALSYAITSADIIAGGLIMLAFGVGTLPSMLALGSVSQTVLQQFRTPLARRLMGLSIILLGLFMLANALGAKPKHEHRPANSPATELMHHQH